MDKGTPCCTFLHGRLVQQSGTAQVGVPHGGFWIVVAFGQDNGVWQLVFFQPLHDQVVHALGTSQSSVLEQKDVL